MHKLGQSQGAQQRPACLYGDGCRTEKLSAQRLDDAHRPGLAVQDVWPGGGTSGEYATQMLVRLNKRENVIFLGKRVSDSQTCRGMLIIN